MPFSPATSLREKFNRAFHRQDAHEKVDAQIIAGLAATEDVFYNSFAQIAATAEQTFHRVIDDIASGRNMAQRPLDVPCMGDISPLRWIVPIPDALHFDFGNQKDYDSVLKVIAENAGCQALRSLCARKDVDVDIDFKIVAASCTDPATGERRSYESVVIDIDLSRPYYHAPAVKAQQPKLA